MDQFKHQNKTFNKNRIRKNIFFSKRKFLNKINHVYSVEYNRKNLIFPKYFADAESNFNDADFVIFGVPFDKTSSFRMGARYGPQDIRNASWNFETFNIITGHDIANIKFHDYGDLDVENDKPEKMVKKVKDFTTNLLEKNKFPIAIGGEHSITSGIIHSYPDDIAVLCLDAHMDFRQKHENEKYNHACVIRRISEYIDIKNIAIIGNRSASKQEYKSAVEKSLLFIDSYKIKEKGIDSFLSQLKNHFNSKKIYLTLDIDVIDPSFAPGVSTPEPFGITPFDVLKIIDFFSSQLVGFDIVELCPPFDNGETALLAAKFVRYVIEKTSKDTKIRMY